MDSARFGRVFGQARSPANQAPVTNDGCINNISALVDEPDARFADRIVMFLHGRPCTFVELADLSRRGAGVLADTGAKLSTSATAA
jgi:hypothetical protein